MTQRRLAEARVSIADVAIVNAILALRGVNSPPQLGAPFPPIIAIHAVTEEIQEGDSCCSFQLVTSILSSNETVIQLSIEPNEKIGRHLSISIGFTTSSP